MRGPLAGIRVAEFGHLLSAPYCTMILADLGADVIKIEPVGKGDRCRTDGMLRIGGNGPAFIACNRNKRSLTLDLKSHDGIEAAIRVIETSDVLVENFTPGSMNRLGLGYKSLAKRKPDLIYCSIRGFASTSKLADYRALDPVLQAYGGLMSVTGTIEGDPIRIGIPICDELSSLWGTIGIMAALREREVTGQGQSIEVPMFNVSVASLSPREQEYWASGQVPRSWGTGHYQSLPSQAFATAKGNIFIHASHKERWPVFCRLIEREELIEDPRFSTEKSRFTNRTIMEPLLEEALKQRTAFEWFEILSAAGIPCSPIRNLQQVLEDPEVQAEMIVKMEAPDGSTLDAIKLPLVMSGLRAKTATAAPGLGAHSSEVLQDVGYSLEEIDRLVSLGVTG